MQIAWLWFILGDDNGLPPLRMIIHKGERGTVALGVSPGPMSIMTSDRQREREIKFIGLFGDRGHQGPLSPYKPCNHNLYIGIIIFPHIDNPQSTGYN